jgi:hypothetical protein
MSNQINEDSDAEWVAKIRLDSGKLRWENNDSEDSYECDVEDEWRNEAFQVSKSLSRTRTQLERLNNGQVVGKTSDSEMFF